MQHKVILKPSKTGFELKFSLTSTGQQNEAK